jgi:SGNH domain-containing protein
LMPLRGWEFISGGAIALAMPAGARLRRSGGAIAALGLAAIVAAATAYGRELNYPSAWPLLPVGGAAGIILSGVVAPGNIVARLLASRPLVGIGLASYSWYLWHWPLLAFSSIWRFGRHSIGVGIVVGLTSLLLAALTYAAIERPARQWRKHLAVGRRWQVVFAGILACGLLGSSGFEIAYGVAPRVAQELPNFLLPADLPSEIDPGDRCVLGSVLQLDPRCLTSAGAMRFGLLIGDSHALALYSTLRERLRYRGVQLIFLFSPACPPVIADPGAERANSPVPCAERNAAGLRSIQMLLGHRLSFAILAAKWASYVVPPPAATDATFGEAERVFAYPMRQFAVKSGGGNQLDWRGDKVLHGLRRLADMQVRRILLIGPVPPAPVDVPSCLVRAYLRHSTLSGQCAYARAQVETQRASAVAMLVSVARRSGNARYADPIDAFCNQVLCRTYDGQTTLFVDNNHLSPAGAEQLYSGLQSAFDWAAAP